MSEGVIEPSVEPNVDEVLANADKALAEFQAFATQEYPKASSLYEGAKNLYEEIKVYWIHDKAMVNRDDWTGDQFDADMKRLAERQTAVWNQLLAAAKVEKERVMEAYGKVQAAEKQVLHLRGEGSHVAWMGLPTQEQSRVRKAYHHKLRANFEQAKNEKDMLVGYPEGLLIKVEGLLQRANKETAHLSEKMHKHVPGGFLARVSL